MGLEVGVEGLWGGERELERFGRGKKGFLGGLGFEGVL